MKMVTLLRVGLVASAALVGCSSTGPASDTSPENTTGSSSGSGTSVKPVAEKDASAPDTGAAAAVTVPLGTVAPTDNAETDYSETQTITMAPFQVPPNQEVFFCQNFLNPWGKQVDIKTYALDMDKGSHHMFAFYAPNPTSDATSSPCPNGGLTFGAFTFGSQAPNAVLTFPDTVGATIPTGTGFLLTAHYVNTTTETMTAHVKLTMYIAKDGMVTNHAGVIFLNDLNIDVPSTGKPVVTTSSQVINQDVNLMIAISHMHKFGTNFVSSATAPGKPEQTLYTTTEWDEPLPGVFKTPVHFPSGTKFSWSCTDVNNTGKDLTFGEYAQTNVMCISSYIFYPVMDVTKPVLGSGIGGF